MQVTQITSLEKETINEAPSIKDIKAKVSQGAKRMSAKLGGKGSASQMGKGLEKLEKGEALPANLAKQLAPFAKGLQAIFADVGQLQKFQTLIAQAEKKAGVEKSATTTTDFDPKKVPNPGIDVAPGAGQLLDGDDGQTYIWQGAQWKNNATGAIAPKDVSPGLSTKRVTNIAKEINKAGVGEAVKAMLTGTKAAPIGPAVR